MRALLFGLLGVAFAASTTLCFAQIDIHIHTVIPSIESHIGNLTGHSGQGKPLYRRFCIGCHGPNGDGNGENAMWFDPTMGFAKPRDFTLAVFKCRSTPTGTLPTDRDLYDAIGRGFDTTNMPQWQSLNKQDRADLVAFVKTFSLRFVEEKPGTPLQIPMEPPSDQDSIDRGRELYQTTIKCSLCHGKEGRGNGPSAATLTDSKGFPIAPYDFTSSRRFKCGESNEDIYRVLMTGLDGSPMASFSNSLKPEQAWDLVHYVRTLQPHFHARDKNVKPVSKSILGNFAREGNNGEKQ